MIDDETKNKLIEELEKSGNVYLSCLKININRSTYYRWKKNDKEFRKKANQAERLGRENNCDIAEHALMLKVKEKDMSAIKYVLDNNSKKYKRKQISNVVILHKKGVPPSVIPEESFEEFEEREEREEHKKALGIYNAFTAYGGKIPNKLDGTPIDIDEIIKYEGYIRDWQELNRKQGQKNLQEEYIKKEILPPPTDSMDSKPKLDVPLAAPQNNQKPPKERGPNSPIEYTFTNITDLNDD